MTALTVNGSVGVEAPALPFTETRLDDPEVLGFGDGYHGVNHWTKPLWTRGQRVAYSQAYIRGVLTRNSEVKTAERANQPIPAHRDITEEECHARRAA